ncbi:hypothetical protein HELRODRAFT_113832 [Helobdella robusta]|uniref:RING-type E3 ubiquitin transferase n=1 Tax=Helobdella robusta TaxID=6412 RepID=T1EFX2_HELRO|nr:hypothetical protein HELRODRAFT_113832 [Helobdella robusta]ESN98511.1 hypothetical protein HELRODRAFT_113832 [Helobdella robusta]
MWIQVRSMDGKKLVRIDGLSKLTKIENLREKLVKHFDAPVERQKLFCRGKMMVDGHTLFDYNIALNEVILILVRPILEEDEKDPTSESTTDGANNNNENNNLNNNKINTDNDNDDDGSTQLNKEQLTVENKKNNLYKVGDVLDIRDVTLGAWFEGDLVKVVPRTRRINNNNSNNNDISNSNDSSKDIGLDDKESKVSGMKEDKMKKKDETNHGSKRDDDDDDDKNDGDDDDGYEYHVRYIGDDDSSDLTIVTSKDLRPRSYRKISLIDLKVSEKVMVNYNYDEPADRGYWYDAVITEIKNTKSSKDVYATIYIGKDLVPMENCRLPFMNEIFVIESPGSQRNSMIDGEVAGNIPNRPVKPECDHCRDDPARKCKHCSCCVCGSKKEPEKQLMCDECNSAYHIYCLKPPLLSVPDDDEWYCPGCKLDTSQVVRAGEKLKESSKKTKMASSQSSSNRDWGKGMACQGRSKMCTIVPSNHFGPVPGVEVGSLWKFRVQVSESGVHRPHVAGIHGRENEGAYSIVLAGGYEDDLDDGYEFTYTGSGGRDLSGNKRTAGQSCDQVLTRMNKALAKNCDAPINSKEGAEANNWKAGKPVRVVRNSKGRKHSQYAPEDGNRYDGIYKVVKYWPEKGKSGFLVWKYLLRRDDPEPAPWTQEGADRSKMLGLVMQYPDGWEEPKKDSSQSKGKDDDDDDDDDDIENSSSGNSKNSKRKMIKKMMAKKKKKKRNLDDGGDDDDNDDAGDSDDVCDADDDDGGDDGNSLDLGSSNKRKKTKLDLDCARDDKENVQAVVSYSPDDELLKAIDDDVINDKLWKDALSAARNGKKSFLEKVESTFTCICCQDIVYRPITTTCQHNFCKDCLTRSFEAGVKTCAICRADLAAMKFFTNPNLTRALDLLFPGYGSAR